MKKLQTIFWLSVPLILIGYLIYKIAMNSFAEHFLGNDPQITKAIIIDEKNFLGNHPIDPVFTYSYSFKINGIAYTGDSHDTTRRVGDTVKVEYNKDHPYINKPLHPKE